MRPILLLLTLSLAAAAVTLFAPMADATSECVADSPDHALVPACNGWLACASSTYCVPWPCEMCVPW